MDWSTGLVYTQCGRSVRYNARLRWNMRNVLLGSQCGTSQIPAIIPEDCTILAHNHNPFQCGYIVAENYFSVRWCCAYYSRGLFYFYGHSLFDCPNKSYKSSQSGFKIDIQDCYALLSDCCPDFDIHSSVSDDRYWLNWRNDSSLTSLSYDQWWLHCSGLFWAQCILDWK